MRLMPERVRWHGLTATYAPHERALMRELPRDEAAVLHEMKARLGATVHRAGVAPAWDERRNTSLVRQTHRYEASDAPHAPIVVNRSREACDTYIGRGSKWGNPYTHRDGTKAERVVGTREEAIDAYREYLAGNHDLLAALDELTGQRLGCYCKPQACHGDVLVEAWRSAFDVDDEPTSEQIGLGI
jgi:hypothetical protein